MITSKLFLKNDSIRLSFKILFGISLIAVGFLLWDTQHISEEIMEAKSTIHTHNALQEQLGQLTQQTSDSIYQEADSISKLGVFNDWIDVAFWLEDNRKSSQKLGIIYSYKIDSLVAHPKSYSQTYELNVDYSFEHQNQDFIDLLKLYHHSVSDTSKSLFLKKIVVSADTNGVRYSKATLGGWLRE